MLLLLSGDDIVSKELKMLPTQGDTTLSDGEIDTSFDEPSLTNNVLKFDNKYSGIIDVVALLFKMCIPKFYSVTYNINFSF